MRCNWLLLILIVTTTILSYNKTNALPIQPVPQDEVPVDTPRLSEVDKYLDLNSGKIFKLIYDGLNDSYNREDLFPMELYVNTRTQDTFWLPEALMVNDALLVDAEGNYKVDPNKVKRDGNGYKVKFQVRHASEPKAQPKPTEPAIKYGITETKIGQQDAVSKTEELKVNSDSQPYPAEIRQVK